jgi:hypothetical protein
MPLIDDEPPSNLPRGIGMRRWPVPSSGSEEYSGVLDQFGKADRDPRPGVAFAARFQHQHPVLRVGAEPAGENRSGRAGAHHDVIEDLAFHVEPVVLR